MKKLILIIISVVAYVGTLMAHDPMPMDKVKIYCEVTCVHYNLFKGDVHAIVDFGIADTAKDANGWIYNSETDKKYSFSSPMNVFKFMADHGWEYKDAIVEKESSFLKWHFILTKEVPVGYTNDDIIVDIDYRTK